MLLVTSATVITTRGRKHTGRLTCPEKDFFLTVLSLQTNKQITQCCGHRNSFFVLFKEFLLKEFPLNSLEHRGKKKT